LKGALGIGLLSLKRLHGGGLGGSSFPGDPRRYVQIVSGYGHLSPGNLRLGGCSYTGDFERWMKEGSLKGEL